MSWDEFLSTLTDGIARVASTDRSEPPPLDLDDENYQKWVIHVAGWIKKHHGKPYRLHLDEDQWAERAIYEGTYAQAPDNRALIAGPAGLPPEPASTAMRRPFENWIENVQRYFESAKEPYTLAADERAWAEQGIRDGLFEWTIEPVSIQLRDAKPPREGPYR